MVWPLFPKATFPKGLLAEFKRSLWSHGKLDGGDIGSSIFLSFSPAPAVVMDDRDDNVLEEEGENGVSDRNVFPMDPMDAAFPQHLEELRQRAQVSYRSGQAVECVQLMSQIIDHAPTGFVESGDYLLRGFALVELGRTEDSVDCFGAAIRMDPKNLSAYYNRAFQNASLKRYFWAVADYTHAVRLAPKDSYCRYNRGWVNRRAGNLSEALRDYTDAIRLRPSFSEPHGDRAYTRLLMLDRKGVPEDSRRIEFFELIETDLTRALMIGYEDSGVMSRWSWRLSYVRFHLGKIDLARSALRTAFEYDKTFSKLDTDLEVMNHLAWNWGRFLDRGLLGEVVDEFDHDDLSPPPPPPNEEVLVLKRCVEPVLKRKKNEVLMWERVVFAAELIDIDLDVEVVPCGSPLPSDFVRVSMTRRVRLDIGLRDEEMFFEPAPVPVLWIFGIFFDGV